MNGFQQVKAAFLTIAIALLLLTTNPATAASQAPDGIGFLLDISGSMKDLVNAPDTKRLIKSLILESSIAPNWPLSEPDQGDPVVQQLLDNDRTPLLNTDNLFLLMKFGELKNDKYPFFEPPMQIEFSSVDQIRDIIDALVPQQTTQNWTYDIIAQATASEMFSSSGRKFWYLFVLSDFDTDWNDEKPSGSPEQRIFEDQWETRQKFQHQPVAIFRNSDKPDVMVKLIRVSLKEAPPSLPEKGGPVSPPSITPRIELLSPSGKTDAKPRFSWTGVNLTDVKGYELLVYEKRSQKLVRSTKRKMQTYTFPDAFDSGEYLWKVKAIFEDGTTQGSQARTFTVGGGGAGAVFGLLMTAGLIGVGFWKQREITDFVNTQIKQFKNKR